MRRRARNSARTCALVCALVSAGGALSLAGCGDVYADPQGSSSATTAGVAVDAASSVFPADVPPQCPSSRPRENSSCSGSGSTCEYGKSADRQCNSMLACIGSGQTSYWESRENDPCFANICPVKADVATLDGQPCALETDGGIVTDADEAVCNMTDGICACTTGRDGATAHARQWVCVRPISVCPPNRPLAGQRCTGGLWCDYGTCSFKRGLVMECKDSVWLTGGAPCQ